MGGMARMDRKKVETFNRYWDRMLSRFPEYRAEAVAAMGEAVKAELGAQIQEAELSGSARGTVKSWQALRLGSGGGYAAVSPQSIPVPGHRGKGKSYKGKPVTSRQVTKWLEKGHGARKPAPGSTARWARVGRSGINLATGTRFVKGRQFYSFTKRKALDLALGAADRCLSRIEDELEFD